MQSQSKRFQDACETMRKNAEKFLDYGLSSSSEDEIDDIGIIQKTLCNYNDESGDLRKIQECLQDVLTSGAIVCLICIESVKRNDQVWSCQSCYCILHLHCITKWAKDSMYHLSANLGEEKKKEPLKWCCPKCRSDYAASEQPVKYFCFCGKVENPSYDSWGVPHGCGKSCDKKLKPDCGHCCSLLCHPGPCPSCAQTVLVSCCCCKSEKISRRCSSKEWVCGKQCNKILACGIHQCEIPCHKGPCPPCNKQSKQKCLCKSSVKLKPCHDLIWQCGKVCSKPLSCGEHFCKLICHKEPCNACPNSGQRLCPCGKNSFVLPCTENVSPCGDTCDKLLQCDLHRCSQRCHFGDCEKCLQMRIMKCRCGQREKSVPCCKEFLCDIKCKKRRDCGRHNCNRKCCMGNCPPCEVLCNKTLNCGQHKCVSLCHPGPCYPCREVADVACNCGVTKVSVPCGRKRSAVPPRCSQYCKLPSDCHHEKRHQHKCHFGSCPPCRLTCGKIFKCNHSCPHRCHSAVLTKVETKQKKEGPWDLINSYRMELVCKPCQPCIVPVPVTCLGGHETHNTPCSSAQSTSCGRKCGRTLICTNHLCNLECHEVDDKTNIVMASSKCETCQESCQKPRKEGCLHPCPRPCHPESCKPCKQHLKIKCHCQINTMYIVCEDWTEAGDNKKSELMSCKNRCPKEMICGHRCILPCHLGGCARREMCKKKIVLRCQCKRKKKEVQCFTQINESNSLLCDEECLEYQKNLQAIENEKISKKEEEIKKIQEKELEEFLRKTEGKKKRKKKNIETKEEFDYRPIVIGTAFFLCIFAVIIYYFL